VSDAWHRCNTALLRVECSHLSHRTPFFVLSTETVVLARILLVSVCPLSKLEKFHIFNVSNVSRLSPSTRCVKAANNICKSLDVFNKHNISLDDTFSFV
jgi:hypothetical protein